SMTLGYLAALVATMPGWIEAIVKDDEIDFKAPHSYKTEEFGSTRELVEAFDRSLEKARRALAGTSDDHLMTNWRLRAGEHIISETPRYVVIQDTFTHLAHHRGQLTVYLRLTGASVPSIYGPSADEGRF
ncbi:MAG TPA: DinB family protein, partial [Terriglobales bacterium]|nr:DinB family protein [Terriglobales bacterium]